MAQDAPHAYASPRCVGAVRPVAFCGLACPDYCTGIHTADIFFPTPSTAQSSRRECCNSVIMPLLANGAELPRCSIYWHEHRLSPKAEKVFTQPHWEHSVRGALELWMERALKAHPWRVYEMDQADIVILGANFSLLTPPSGRRYVYNLFRHWSDILRNSPLLLLQAMNGSINRPVVAAFLDTTAPMPWKHAPPPRLHRLRDIASGRHDIAAPPVLTGSKWPSASDDNRRWRSRPLLFFAGHTPKLHINPLRYHLLTQLHGRPGVFSRSSTVGCTVRPYHICTTPALLQTSYKNFCFDGCAQYFRQAAQGNKSCAENVGALRQVCRRGGYATLPWSEHLPAIDAAQSVLSPAEYTEKALEHRFCLAAPGDSVATPKIVEFIHAAARGGCVPVIMIKDCVTCARARRGVQVDAAFRQRWEALPAGMRGEAKADFNPQRLASLETHAAQILPFSRWRLDFCAMAYIVPESRANNMTAVLEMLERVTKAEAARKRAMCIEASPVLSYRGDDNPLEGRAGASTHLLSELCQRAQSAAAGNAPPLRPLPLPVGFDERCLILPPTARAPRSAA